MNKKVKYEIEAEIREINDIKRYLNKLLENGFYSIGNEAEHIKRLRTQIGKAKQSSKYSDKDIKQMEEELELAEKLWELRRKKARILIVKIKEYLKQQGVKV